MINSMLLALGEGLLVLSQSGIGGKALSLSAGVILCVDSLIYMGVERHIRHKESSPQNRPTSEA